MGDAKKVSSSNIASDFIWKVHSLNLGWGTNYPNLRLYVNFIAVNISRIRPLLLPFISVPVQCLWIILPFDTVKSGQLTLLHNNDMFVCVLLI